MLATAANVLVRALLSPVCASCRARLDRPLNGPICDPCWRAIRRLTPPWCDWCGDALPAGPRLVPLCARCLQAPPSFDVARSAALYDGSVRELIHVFKYERRRMLAAPLARLLLAAGAGLQTTSLGSLFSAPSRFWSLGPSLLQTLFDGGRRRAAADQARASYDAAVAAYRQSALGAFQEVEDGLAAQRILGTEAAQQGAATAAADRLVTISRSRYRGGITSYLEVSIAETVALNNHRAGVQVLTRRLTNGVALVKALGGGWEAATLPPPDAVLAGASSNR